MKMKKLVFENCKVTIRISPEMQEDGCYSVCVEDAEGLIVDVQDILITAKYDLDFLCELKRRMRAMFARRPAESELKAA